MINAVKKNPKSIDETEKSQLRKMELIPFERALFGKFC